MNGYFDTVTIVSVILHMKDSPSKNFLDYFYFDTLRFEPFS